MRVRYIILLLLLSGEILAQDVITTETNSFKGKITRITADTIFFDTKTNNVSVSTYVDRNNVEYYSFGYIEKIKDNYDSTLFYSITTIDRSIIAGKIKEVYHDSILIHTIHFGELCLRAEFITDIQSEGLTTDKAGKYWFENPNATRYLFGPSAYNLEKGEGYYQNTYVVLNMFNVGLTDYFSIGGGFEFISTFTGNPTMFITPKVGFRVSKNLNAGVGVIGGVVGGEATAGIMYGIGTYGNKEHNFTGGLGYGFIDGEMGNMPIITFSGMTRVGRKVSLVTENWMIHTGDKYYGIFTYGLRLFGPKTSFDVAFINNKDIAEEIFIGIPYVDFVIRF